MNCSNDGTIHTLDEALPFILYSYDEAMIPMNNNYNGNSNNNTKNNKTWLLPLLLLLPTHGTNNKTDHGKAHTPSPVWMNEKKHDDVQCGWMEEQAWGGGRSCSVHRGSVNGRGRSVVVTTCPTQLAWTWEWGTIKDRHPYWWCFPKSTPQLSPFLKFFFNF